MTKILKGLSKIAPHLRAINGAACLLIDFRHFSGRAGLLLLLMIAATGPVSRSPGKLIFFLKEVVRTNGSLSLLGWGRRAVVILCILDVGPPLLLVRGQFLV